MDSTPTKITILHFNDVYNIESRGQEPVGGAARFKSAIRTFENLNPMVLFSGDALSPSITSTVTRGKHMIPVLNAMNIQCAVYGNHEFDYGVDNLVDIAKQHNFPWLLSNAHDTVTGNPFGEAVVTHLLPWQGKKIGFIGLIECDWVETLSTVRPKDIYIRYFVDEGRRLAKQLREQGADYIIALTHMRWESDIRLAENVDEIDLILGGHDHDFGVQQVNGKYIIKSGTDFRQFAHVTLTFGSNGKVGVEVVERTVDSSLPEDPDVKGLVDKFAEMLDADLGQVLGQMSVEMNGLFDSVRSKETNLGNFMTNIMLATTDSDVALLNSGCLRSDQVHPKGDFKIKDLRTILPLTNQIVVIQVTGQELLDALENGVSKYPELEGRFPQVAGMNFSFDPTKPPGSRIDKKSVYIQQEHDETIDLNKTYKMCTLSYVADGHDGYDVLKNCPVLLNSENGPQLSTAVINHFESVQILSGAMTSKYHHWQSIISTVRRKCLSQQMEVEKSKLLTEIDKASNEDRVKEMLDGVVCRYIRQNMSQCDLNALSGASTVDEALDRIERTMCTYNKLDDPEFSALTEQCQKVKATMIVACRSVLEAAEREEVTKSLAPSVEGRIINLNIL